MYNTMEEFADDGKDLYIILKECIKNYFRIKLQENDLQFSNDNIINTVSNEMLQNVKGVKDVL